MKKWMIGLAAAMMLAACSQEEEQTSSDEMPQMVEVEISVPEDAVPGEETVVQAEVTQGGEAVEDAHEVLFEIWNDATGTESERVEGTHTENGVYEVTYTFEESVYTVQAHTTARDMHVMPKTQFHVGEPTDEQIAAAEENAENQESSHMDSDEDHDHSEEDHSHDEEDHSHDEEEGHDGH
ncbi:FixH family protein [Jeotgalibacillus malaysiensis]|uniref:FixH family protein n=1 Tax=Jeotgalibacillus malaysiensis TaxID=1508404 RepID=UPI003850B65C